MKKHLTPTNLFLIIGVLLLAIGIYLKSSDTGFICIVFSLVFFGISAGCVNYELFKD
jgi:uncharacterized membrane protein YiaA